MLTSELSLPSGPTAGHANRLGDWNKALALPDEPAFLMVRKDRAAAPESPVIKLEAVKLLALALVATLDGEDQNGSSRGPGINLREEVKRFEATLIKSALAYTGGRQRRAARLLGMNVSSLNARIKRYKLAAEIKLG